MSETVRCLLTGTRFSETDYDDYVDFKLGYLDSRDVILRREFVVSSEEVPPPFSSDHEVFLTMDSANTILCASSSTSDTRGRHESLELQSFFRRVEQSFDSLESKPSYSEIG